MRLQLIAAAALTLAAGPARADTRFASKVQLYVDDDHTTVISPLVHAESDVTPVTEVDASYVADVVSSASIDIVSQASQTTIHDTRHQASLGMRRILDAFTVSGKYLFSIENDYRSHNVEAGVERRLAKNDTTIAAGYALSLNEVGRAGDENFHRALDVHAGSVTLTQIVTPTLAAQLGYTIGVADGYQASPYRYVPVREHAMDPPSYWVPEHDPDTRWRHGVVVGANQHLFTDTALQGDYRFYVDSWGIRSHTAQARWLVELGDAVELRLRARLYTQSAARFYRARYGELERYMTVDRELSRLDSILGGAKVVWRTALGLELELKADAFYYRYPEFPLLPTRLGASLGVGLAVDYL